MPRRRRPRKNKSPSDLLINKEQFIDGRFYVQHDRENIVGRMDMGAMDIASNTIRERIESAAPITEDLRDKMHKWDLQYIGKFQDDAGESEDRIFLPKTREEVNGVKAFIISLISQLNPLIKMEPMGTSTIWGNEEDYSRAKLAEAMFNFYVKDIWRFVDDILPNWLNHFLKYSMAIYKVSYYETDWEADLKLEVIDRAFLYIDPHAHDISEAQWVAQEYYIPYSELIERIDRKDWIISDSDIQMVETAAISEVSTANLERYFGEQRHHWNSIEEDERIKVVDYWQFDRQGLPDAFATIVGGSAGSVVTGGGLDGVLARFGRNPFPYKGNPFVGKSFNPDESRPDGQGMPELQQAFQMAVNTFVNFRTDDVRKNIQQPTLVLEELVDATTQDDFKKGHSLVRAGKEVSKYIMENPGRKLGDFISHGLATGTSTQELLTLDLPFILNQGQQSSNISDVFRGMNPQPGATLGQIQEQLTRNSGMFRPVLRQVMRSLEQVAEITMSYFRDPEFFPEERIVRIIGQNKYVDVIQGWHKVGENTFFKSVTADDMDTDVTFDGVSGSDAMASRTLLVTTIERIFQSIGQIPEIANELRNKIDFAELTKQLLSTTSTDTEALMLSPEEQQRKRQEDEAAQMRQLQMQQQVQESQMALQAQLKQMEMQLAIVQEQNKQQAMAQKQIAVDANKSVLQTKVDENRIELENDAKLEQIIEQILQKKIADTQLAILQQKLDEKTMVKEGEIEKDNAVQNVSPSGGQNVQQGGQNA